MELNLTTQEQIDYLKLLMDSNIKKLFVVEHPNIQILN